MYTNKPPYDRGRSIVYTTIGQAQTIKMGKIVPITYRVTI